MSDKKQNHQISITQSAATITADSDRHEFAFPTGERLLPHQAAVVKRAMETLIDERKVKISGEIEGLDIIQADTLINISNGITINMSPGSGKTPVQFCLVSPDIIRQIVSTHIPPPFTTSFGVDRTDWSDRSKLGAPQTMKLFERTMPHITIQKRKLISPALFLVSVTGRYASEVGKFFGSTVNFIEIGCKRDLENFRVQFNRTEKEAAERNDGVSWINGIDAIFLKYGTMSGDIGNSDTGELRNIVEEFNEIMQSYMFPVAIFDDGDVNTYPLATQMPVAVRNIICSATNHVRVLPKNNTLVSENIFDFIKTNLMPPISQIPRDIMGYTINGMLVDKKFEKDSVHIPDIIAYKCVYINPHEKYVALAGVVGGGIASAYMDALNSDLPGVAAEVVGISSNSPGDALKKMLGDKFDEWINAKYIHDAFLKIALIVDIHNMDMFEKYVAAKKFLSTPENRMILKQKTHPLYSMAMSYFMLYKKMSEFGPKAIITKYKEHLSQHTIDKLIAAIVKSNKSTAARDKIISTLNTILDKNRTLESLKNEIKVLKKFITSYGPEHKTVLDKELLTLEEEQSGKQRVLTRVMEHLKNGECFVCKNSFSSATGPSDQINVYDEKVYLNTEEELIHSELLRTGNNGFGIYITTCHGGTVCHNCFKTQIFQKKIIDATSKEHRLIGRCLQCRVNGGGFKQLDIIKDIIYLDPNVDVDGIINFTGEVEVEEVVENDDTDDETTLPNKSINDMINSMESPKKQAIMKIVIGEKPDDAEPIERVKKFVMEGEGITIRPADHAIPRKLIIYSQFVEALNEIGAMFDEFNSKFDNVNIRHVRLIKGHSSMHILKEFEDDNNCSCSVLLIQSTVQAAGHNIQFADAMIFHDVATDIDMLKQMMGRIQRVGRKFSGEYYFLMYRTESVKTLVE